MRIQEFHPDEEGYMRVKNMVRPLSFGVRDEKPTLWAIVEPLGKVGQNVNIVVKRNNETVPPELVGNYACTLNIETGEVWHVFQEPSKLVGPVNLGGLKA